MACNNSHEREVQMNIVAFFALTGVLLCVGGWVHFVRRRQRRESFLRGYEIPAAVFTKFSRQHPALSEQQRQLVARGLQQFFLAYLKSGFAYVAMPSKVADDLWHEFILFTREYHDFCEQAFGRHLHHSPAGGVDAKKSEEGMNRAWWFACREEEMRPRHASRLPLLFALDQMLGIRDGFTYDLARQRAKAVDYAAASSAGGATGAGAAGCTSGDGGAGCSGGCGGGCGGGG
jgi:hypothetical protein